MTEMMQQIQNDNQSQINELAQKLAFSERRTEEMQGKYDKQMHESKLLTEKYESLRTALSEEETRCQSLMELNGALKQNMMALHSEKDELEESIDGLKEDMGAIAMGFQQQLLSSTNELAQLHNRQNNEKLKIMAMIDDLKEQKDAIAAQFEQYKRESEAANASLTQQSNEAAEDNDAQTDA